MPRTITIEKTIYKFDELSDAAKEKARDWLRTCNGEDSYWSESVIEDAARIGGMMGIDVNLKPVPLHGGGTRMDPVIYWSGFSSQGDGACFECSYSYAKGCAKAVKREAPKDEILHRIVDGLVELQKRNRYLITATTRHRGHYYHAYSMDVELDGCNDADHKALSELFSDFANWIYRNLEREYEWQNADEQIDDSIRANEYDFDENGRRA